MTRHVLIIEDHPLVAEATAKLLASSAEQIRPLVCSDARQTIEELDRGHQDWFRIFLDLDVPGAYGLSLAKEIKDRGFAGRSCVVSAFEKAEYIDELKRWNFLGYIFKALPISEFTDALKRVLEGEISFPSGRSGNKAPMIRLTRRQTQLLELIRLGLSSREIGLALHIAEGTVNNHVAAILQVFDAMTRAHAVAKAIEHGLLDSNPQSVTPAWRRSGDPKSF